MYWENFLSNAERSFGAIPSIIGSLPYGTDLKGFMNMDHQYVQNRKYPKHVNLINWLKQNGYFTSFFYGGWGYFDNMGYYIKESGIDIFVDESNFNTGKYKKNSINCWGFSDKQLFSQSFDVLDSKKRNIPYLSIYCTLSLHDPYNLVDSKYESNDFIDNKLRSRNIDFSLKQKLGNDLIKSIIYVDDALSEFFDKYKMRDDFDETIFVIVGDHGIKLNTNNIFENYNVPLIVYSPLLEKSGKFKGVSTQLDILPSLYSLLSSNFIINKLAKSSWLGSGLDTSVVFKSKSISHLSLFSNTNPNFIYRNYVSYNENIFRFNSMYHKELLSNSDTISMILKFIKSYRTVNYMFCKYDKLYE